MSGRTVVGEVKIKVSFDAGKGQKQTDKLNKGVSNLTKGAYNLGRGFERLGRTISITGFVMGIVARRVIGAFEGIAKSIIKISEEGANLDKAFTFLGDTLSALALSGMLTDDVFNRIIGTFWEMFNIAQQSAGSWAIINDAIQQLKNAIALGALPALTSLSDFLLRFDLGPFKEALAEATNTFLTPIIAKIKELLGDGESGVIGVKEKLNAIAEIGGTFLAGVLEGFDQMMIKAAELIGDDKKGILGIVSKFGEYAAWALLLAPLGAVTGMIIGGFGSIIMAVSGLIGIFGGVGALTLLGVMAVIASDWGTWNTELIPNLTTAVNNLAKEFGFESGLGFVLTTFNNFLTFVGDKLEDRIRTLIDFIDLIASAIRQIKQLAGLMSGSGDVSVGGEGPIGSYQHGGVIPKTGAYLMHAGERVMTRTETRNSWSPTFYITGGDPQEIARQVDRILSQRSRSPYMAR